MGVETVHDFGEVTFDSDGAQPGSSLSTTGLAPTGDIDPIGPPPPSSDIAALAAWQIAKRQTERVEAERQTPGPDRAVGR